MWRMDDHTRRIPRDNSGDRTEYLGPTTPAPRQYMPGEENQTAYIGNYDSYENYDNYSDPQPYDEPYRPESYNRRDQYNQPVVPEREEKNNTSAIAWGAIAVLLCAAAVVLFFLWRGAETRANQPPPAPVTLTETETVTTSKEGFLDGLLNRDKDGEGEITLPTELPTDLPTEIPTEIPEDVRNDFQSMLDELKSLIDQMKTSN